MTEAFIHYIWKHQLFEKENLQTTEGDSLEIITPGSLNTDAGPDFSNARIKINDTIWAGNVEIHTDSSHWNNHQHHHDKAYNNVILHVVSKYSKPTLNKQGELIPALELRINPTLQENFKAITDSSEVIPCAPKINLTDGFTIAMWMDTMCIERLEQKTEVIRQILNQQKSDWEACFYIFLARGFGLKTNSLPFEMLARLTPYKLILKYSNNLPHLEALLFGQAGFLDDNFTDEYARNLQKEYHYLKKVHQLTSVEKHLWKFMRLRPANFPTIRIAQFANLLHVSKNLFSKVIECKTVNDLKNLMNCSVSDYWLTHYSFDKESSHKKKTIGSIAINNLLINTVIPFIFIYGKERNRTELYELAVNHLEDLPPESNKITRLWKELNIETKNAAESQALIQLTNNYCSEKNCLYCQIGNSLIQKIDT